MNNWWNPLQSRGSATLSIFNSTEVRQPPGRGRVDIGHYLCGAKNDLLRTDELHHVTGSPTGQITCGEMPRPDSLWLRMIIGSAG